MSKKYKVVVNVGKNENNEVIDVVQNQGDRGQTLRIPAKAGAKYQLQEVGKDKNAAPEYVRVKRLGKNLHLTFEDGTQSDVVIEDYYEVMPEGYNGIVGETEQGIFYEYIPEDPNTMGLIPRLADGGELVSVALGGGEVVGSGAEIGLLAFNPLLAALGLAGAGIATAAATAAAGGTGTTTDAPKIVAVTDNVGNPAGASAELVSGGPTNDNTPTLSGTTTPNEVVTVKDGDTVLGTATAGPDGKWSFTPTTALGEGQHSLTASTTANGTTGTSAPFVVEVDTKPPVATLAVDTVTADNLVSVQEAGLQSLPVTGTITDVDSPTTFIEQTDTAGTFGKLSLTAAGVWSYTMNSAQNQFVASQVYTDTFTVMAADGTTQQVSVNITGTNDAPINTLPGTQSTAESTATYITGLSIFDADAGVGSMSVTLAVTNGVLFLTGSDVTFVGNNSASVQVTGTRSDLNTLLASPLGVRFTPTTNFNGTATLSMTTSDGSLSDVDTLNILVSSVNFAPVNTVPGAQTAAEDTNKVITGLSVSDPDGNDNLTVTLAITNGTLTLLTGTGVTLGGNNSTSVTLSGTVSAINALLTTSNAVTYKPTPNFSGSSTLTMTSSDGTLSDSDTVDITVNPANDAPVITDTNLSMATVGTYSGNPAGAVGSLVSSFVGGITDIDSGALQGMAITGVDATKGTLWYSTNGGTNWTQVTGTLSNTNALLIGSDADNRLYFKPVAGVASGLVSSAISFRAWDQTSGAEGTYASTATNGATTAFSTNVETISQMLPVDLNNINSSLGGFVINGESTDDRSGWRVSNAGDVNGDGFDDILIGALTAEVGGTFNAGKSYVVFGKVGLAAINLSAVAAGTGGFVVNGWSESDYMGISVSAAGDVNGDGLADVMVSASNGRFSASAPADNVGHTYIVYGKTSTTAVNASDIAANSGGFYIYGRSSPTATTTNDDELTGKSIRSAGDVNGDGISDFIIGAPDSDPASGADAGRTYVVFGKSTGAISLRDVANGTGGFVVLGESAVERSG